MDYRYRSLRRPGRVILEETASDQPHDEWLMAAREAFLKWKEVHHITMTPPANLKAQ